MRKGKRRAVLQVEALEDRLPLGDLLALALPDIEVAHRASDARLPTEESVNTTIAGMSQQDEATDEDLWSVFPEEQPGKSRDRPVAQRTDDKPSFPLVNSNFGDFGEAWLSVGSTSPRARTLVVSTLGNGGSHWDAAPPALEAASRGAYASVLPPAIRWNDTVTALTWAASAPRASAGGADEAGLLIRPGHPSGVQAPESLNIQRQEWSPWNGYEIRLRSEPTAAVEVFIRSPDNQVCFGDSEIRLTFDVDGWEQDQGMIVLGCRDFRNEPFVHTGTIRHTTVSEDPAYNGLVVNLTVTLYDTDADTSWSGPALASHPMVFIDGGEPYDESYSQRIEELRIVAPDPKGESDPYRAQQSLTDPDGDYDGFFGLNRHPDDYRDCEEEICSEVHFLARRPGVYGVQVAFMGGATDTFFINVASPPADAGQGPGQTEEFVAAVHPTAADTTLILVESPAPENVDVVNENFHTIIRSRRLDEYKRLAASVFGAANAVLDYHRRRGSPLHVWINGHGSADAQHVGAGNAFCHIAGDYTCLRQNPLEEVRVFGTLLRGKIDTLTMMGCNISVGIDRPDSYLNHLSRLLSDPTVTAKVRGYNQCTYGIPPEGRRIGWWAVPRSARLRVSTNGRPD